MDYQFKVLREESVYQGFFKLKRYQVDFELFRGGFSGSVMRECAATTGYVVAALAHDPARQEFILVEQFRIGAMAAGVHPWQLEIVAGFMDKTGETPEQCVQRELEEEIGTKATRLERVCTYFGGPGGSAGQTHLFFAEVDGTACQRHTGLLDEGEDILVHHASYEQVYDWLCNGDIQNATMILAVQAFFLKYGTKPFLA